jgi:hypothetical protein
MPHTAQPLSVGAGPGTARRVEDVRPLHPWSMDQGEEIASDSAGLGSNDSKHGIGSDGGINRVSTCCDHRHRGLGREDMGSCRSRPVPVEGMVVKGSHLSGEAQECGD